MMPIYKCAYCPATFERDDAPEIPPMPASGLSQEEFDKLLKERFAAADRHHAWAWDSEFRAHVLEKHPGQPIHRIRVT